MKYLPYLLAVSAIAVFSGLSVSTAADKPAHAEQESSIIAADKALALLKEGNQRFVSGHTEHPHQNPERRTELAGGQHPFAIVLGCADSRTSPEVLFDQGLGDLFVVRVAGNVVNDETEGSIEYAIEHLGARLIVVLGHERCGAVKAARETIAANKEAPGHIQSLVKAIRPSVDATKDSDVETTCKVNIKNVSQILRDCDPILKEYVSSGKVAVVGAYYDLDSGKVEFLEDNVAAK